MATQRLSRISSASISARRTTGRRSARAATSSGLSRLIAEDTTTTAALVDILGLMADRDRDALVAQPLDVGALGDVRPLHGVAEIEQHLGDAAHADAADADEMHRTDVARQFHAVAPVIKPFPEPVRPEKPRPRPVVNRTRRRHSPKSRAVAIPGERRSAFKLGRKP